MWNERNLTPIENDGIINNIVGVLQVYLIKENIEKQVYFKILKKFSGNEMFERIINCL